MERRYTALGFIAGLYQIAGVIVLAGSILLGGLALVSSNSSYGYTLGFTTGLSTIIVGGLSGIGLYAFGELLNLFRDMELNSRIAADNSAVQAEYARRTAQALEQLAYRRRQQAAAPMPPQNLPPNRP